MVQELFDKNIFIYIMLALCACGILLKFILSLVYSRLVRATDNMAKSKNKLTQMMKKKFETYYVLKIGVNNVDIFVDKYVFRHRFCGILLSTWENFCGQILVLCLLVGSISTILGLIYECGKQQILSTFSVGILTSGLLIFLEGFVNLSARKELIRLNMKDYFENILKVRLEQEQEQPELIEQYKKEYLHEEAEQALNSRELLAAANEENTKLTRKEKKAKKNELKAAKLRKKRMSKQAKRLEKKRIKADAKLAAMKRKEEKRLLKEKKKLQKAENRKKIKEEKERIKMEAKLALERKREAERAELERIKAEVKANEERKREEKRRQEELKKALLMEKKALKSSRSKARTLEYKTIAQERKENLKREILERRNLESQNEEKNIQPNDKEEDKIAVTLMNEKPLAIAEKFKAEKVQLEKVALEPAHVDKPKVEKAQVIGPESSEEPPVMGNRNLSKPVTQKPRKQSATADDKLIEDILKEFLA